MNFQRANHKLTLLEDFYNCFNEDTRLKRRHGIVEYTTNMKYIHEYLNDDKTEKILDIGAGTGAYSVPLSNEGYEVHAIELVQHNLDILHSKKSNVIARQGNALNLDMYLDNSFDIVLLFGPMYHLLKEEEKIQALKEAQRVCKKTGYIFVSYYMNDYAIITYGFIKGNILESKKKGMVDDSYHVVAQEGDLYSMVRIEDIDAYNNTVGLRRVKIIASDGASDYIRTPLNKLPQEAFEEYLKYHLSICERKDLLGASSHLMDIVQK